jgi:hypothetical protein
VRFHQPPLVRIERPPLTKDAVRNPDLADVVQKEPVFGAGVAEQIGRHGSCELERIPLHALGMCARAAVFRLERAGKRDHGGFVGVLQQEPLTALDLEQPAKIFGAEVLVCVRRRVAAKECDPHAR